MASCSAAVASSSEGSDVPRSIAEKPGPWSFSVSTAQEIVFVDKVEDGDAKHGIVLGCIPHQFAMQHRVAGYRNMKAGPYGLGGSS